MKVLQSLFIIIVILLIFSYSNSTETKNKRFLVSNWIGYAPLLYAYEKGLLEKFKVEIIATTSLQASLHILKNNSFDGMALTQREYNIINNNRKKREHFIPIAIFDRSYGGDAIVSNIPKSELFKNHYKNIKVTLEENSVNIILFEALKKLNNWGDTKFSLYNMSQKNISQMDMTKELQLIITYEPYLSKLKSKGFHLIESTKNDKILVFDALAVHNNLFHKEEIAELQTIIAYSINKLKSDPKDFFETVKIYFNGMSFEEFILTLDEMRFVTNDNYTQMIDLIKKEKIFDNLKYLEK